MIACTCSTSVVQLRPGTPHDTCPVKQCILKLPMQTEHDGLLQLDQTNFGLPDMHQAAGKIEYLCPQIW